MSSFELLAGRPFPLGRGLVLRNRLVGTAHAAGLVSGGLARPEDAAYWRRRARKCGFPRSPGWRMRSAAVGNGWAEVTNTMSRTTRRIAADTVIVVGERRARDWRSLVPPGPAVRVIGDALVPRRVAHAISEGRAAAEAIRDSWVHTNRATARA